MPTRERPADRGRRRVRLAIQRLVEDARRARIAAGLRQEDVAAAIGVSRSRISRVERDSIESPQIDFLAAMCAAVGLDLVVRAYPAGDALRDAGHGALLGRLRGELHPSLGYRTEQGFPTPGDLRAWDAVIVGRGWICHVEAETVITDGQELTRRLFLKARDGGRGRLVLLVADTRRNRDALHVIRRSLSDTLPLDTRAVLRALRRGQDPGGDGVVIL